jgi:S1-C subfamily serine protease
MTIQSSDAAPGAARLPNGASIPSLVQRVVHSVVSIDVRNNGQEDQGTGMIITADGMVVTNNHVIALGANGGTITVTASGSTKALPTVLVGADPSNDVALLRIENASGLTPVTFGNSSKIEVGDAAVAIGNALGLAAGTPTVTSGIISALGRTVTAGDGSSGGTETLTNMIQTDAAINPGNSGGPLLDSAGEVIGMNTAVAGSSVGSNAQNIGFAITSARIKSLLPQLEKGGTSTSNHGGYMGVQIATLTPDLREQYNLVPTEGAIILDVMAGSPASSAGLRQGDVIVEIDGKKITSADQVTEITRSHKPGDALKVTVQRGRERLDLKVTLGTPPQ